MTPNKESAAESDSDFHAIEDSATDSDSDFHASDCETELRSSTSASSTQISDMDEEEPSDSADPSPPHKGPYFLRTTALKVDAQKSTANQHSSVGKVSFFHN